MASMKAKKPEAASGAAKVQPVKAAASAAKPAAKVVQKPQEKKKAAGPKAAANAK